jgi:hypothetical protein
MVRVALQNINEPDKLLPSFSIIIIIIIIMFFSVVSLGYYWGTHACL